MNSVTGIRHGLQWILGCFAIFTIATLLGCKPSEPAKKPDDASKSPAATSPAAQPAATADQKPAVEKPAAEKAAPAKQPETKTSAQPATTADETLTPAVLWMPKPTDNPKAVAQRPADMKPYSEQIANTDIQFDMVPIPGGTFKMGSPVGEKDRNADEGPQVEVQIDPFWMGKCEVTWGEFEQWGLGIDQQRRTMKKTPMTAWNKAADALAIPTKPYSDMTFGMGKDGYPAVCMTQFAAKMYCKWLSAKTGRYYRLPTEAEWEYACRAGTTGPYSFGADPAKLDDYAWSEANSDEKYHKVGQKKPNPWGLYDMHGNVAEWCLDQYVADRYKQLGGQLVKNPLLPVTASYPQVVRGGAWTDEAPLLRSAARRGSNRDWKSQDPQIPQSIWYFTDANFVGFRVVRPLHKPTPEEAARYEVTPFEKSEYLDYKSAQAGKQ